MALAIQHGAPPCALGQPIQRRRWLACAIACRGASIPLPLRHGGGSFSLLSLRTVACCCKPTAEALTVNLGSSPIARSGNVFWQVGSSATLGAGSTIRGSILAFTSITATTGAIVDGRPPALGAAVTLDTNAVTVPPLTTCQVVVQPVAGPVVAGQPTSVSAVVTCNGLPVPGASVSRGGAPEGCQQVAPARHRLPRHVPREERGPVWGPRPTMPVTCASGSADSTGPGAWSRCTGWVLCSG
ncbi:ice-binding family protein [Streptomyces platensis]|uniref:ice-binding family protein n=1 Tax=Streptomyces platensis TaxID=58346 RepID=UPI0038683E1A|nr:ice-binding family protein [Streptomyces platensis]